MTRDNQKQRVYDAENILRAFYDRSVESGNPVVEIQGVILTLPPEGKFGSVESVQAYCDKVTGMVKDIPVRVRARKGDSYAHYKSGVVAVPDGRHRWAMREIVILHELAHHLTRHAGGHGPEFVAAFIDLLSRVMGPEVGLALRLINVSGSVRESAV